LTETEKKITINAVQKGTERKAQRIYFLLGGTNMRRYKTNYYTIKAIFMSNGKPEVTKYVNMTLDDFNKMIDAYGFRDSLISVEEIHEVYRDFR
jgi:hypothetical protein